MSYDWTNDKPMPGCEFAARLRPGMAVDGANVYMNEGDPDVINVSHVEDLDDGNVRIFDVSGWSAVTGADMCMQIMTPELADLMGFVVLAEQDRVLGSVAGGAR